MDARISKFLPKYFATLPKQIADLEEFAGAGDAQSLRRALHDVKSTSEMFGFPRISAAARDAEAQIIETGSVEGVAEHVRAIAEELRKVQVFSTVGANHP